MSATIGVDSDLSWTDTNVAKKIWVVKNGDSGLTVKENPGFRNRLNEPLSKRKTRQMTNIGAATTSMTGGRNLQELDVVGYCRWALVSIMTFLVALETSDALM